MRLTCPLNAGFPVSGHSPPYPRYFQGGGDRHGAGYPDAGAGAGPGMSAILRYNSLNMNLKEYNL